MCSAYLYQHPLKLRSNLALSPPKLNYDDVDRSKDVINSGSEKEVESVLYWNPAVNEAAVVAKPDKFYGVTPCAFVCLKSAGLDCSVPSEDIMEFCKERLPHFLAPKTVVFTEALPKTSTVQKFVLREIAMSVG
ncbi:unnamed protein product [Prunus armeniaca]